MASSYTQNYKLCQWEAEDKVLRTEFNADNLKIDQALAGKASAAALSSLQSTVSGKASQSALDALSATVSQHAAALTGKGNCILYTTSYTGNNAETKTLTFSKPPQLVVVGGGNGVLVLVRGVRYTPGLVGSFYLNTVTWSGNSVTWTHSGSGGAGGALNANGSSYYVVALLKAD